MFHPIVLIAVLTVLVLSLYAARLLYLVKKQRLQRDTQQRSLDEFNREQRQRSNTSIQVLARAILEGQVSLTEGCIRIRGLMESLAVTEQERQDFNAFYCLADLTGHIPTLAEWKKLSRKEQRGFEKERLALEAKHKEFVLDAAKCIDGYNFQPLYSSAV